jgi:hypothetical protein
MPVEWLDAGSWRLPSGKALAEFALQAGFLAPLLLRSEQFNKKKNRTADVAGSLEGGEARSPKHFGKGESR